MSKATVIKVSAVAVVCAGLVALDQGYFKSVLVAPAPPSSKKRVDIEKTIIGEVDKEKKALPTSTRKEKESGKLPKPSSQDVAELMPKLEPKALRSSIPPEIRFELEPEAVTLSDQVAVKFDPQSRFGKSLQSNPAEAIKQVSRGQDATLSLVRVGQGVAVIKYSLSVPDEVSKRAAVKKLISAVQATQGVQGIEEDVMIRPSFVPNDSRYAEQWYLNKTMVGGANASPAWDTTTGTNNGKSAVIAIVDTGVTRHSDLTPNLLPGFDFISDPARSSDGSGWDADPSDMGDGVTANESALVGGPLYGCAPRNSSWHGTHVAGIAAGVGGNGNGIVGVAPTAKILPIRVAGKCGGYSSDVAEGVRWAAGLPVDGAPPNPNKATVINLSLGGRGACSSYLQSAINDAKKAGAVVVVAAGNGAADAKGYSPANCQGVISVGAVAQNGDRAYYSNFGANVQLSAPGGDARESATILSTINTGAFAPGGEGYGFYQGTSMAAPVVSGGIALAMTKNDKLGPAGALTLITKMARKFGPESDCAKQANCGVGIIDIGAAIGQAQKYVPDVAVTKLLLGNGVIAPNIPFEALVNLVNVGLAPTSSGQGGKVELFIATTAGESPLKIGEAPVADLGVLPTHSQKQIKIAGLMIPSKAPFSSLEQGRYGLIAKFISGDWEENKDNNTSRPAQADFLIPELTLTKKMPINQAPADIAFTANFNDSRISRLAIGSEWKYDWLFTSGVVVKAEGQKALLKVGEPGQGKATLTFKHTPSGYQTQASIDYELVKAEDSVISFTETASNTFSRAPITFRFSPQISVGHPADSVASIQWDFNNGEMTSTRTNAVVTLGAGHHVIKASAKTKMGFTANFEKVLNIKENEPPTCRIDYASPAGEHSILFTADCSDVDGAIKGVAWYMDGRRVSAQPRSPFTYKVQTEGAGTMTVKVMVADDAKAIGEAQVTVAY